MNLCLMTIIHSFPSKKCPKSCLRVALDHFENGSQDPSDGSLLSPACLLTFLSSMSCHSAQTFTSPGGQVGEIISISFPQMSFRIIWAYFPKSSIEILIDVMATHSSVLAWKIPWTEEPSRLQSMGLQRVGHNRVTSLTHSLTHS